MQSLQVPDFDEPVKDMTIANGQPRLEGRKHLPEFLPFLHAAAFFFGSSGAKIAIEIRSATKELEKWLFVWNIKVFNQMFIVLKETEILDCIIFFGTIVWKIDMRRPTQATLPHVGENVIGNWRRHDMGLKRSFIWGAVKAASIVRALIREDIQHARFGYRKLLVKCELRKIDLKEKHQVFELISPGTISREIRISSKL
jgi:hypothetical protein